MSVVDIIILVAIAAILIFCLVKLFTPGASSCDSCGSASNCAAHKDGSGCLAVQKMLLDATSALNAKESGSASARSSRNDPSTQAKSSSLSTSATQR